MINPVLLQHNHDILAAGSRLGYQICVLLATFVGGYFIRRDSANWPMSAGMRISILMVALIGSMIGCAIPAFFAGGLVEELSWTTPLTPKTVIGGLFLSYVFVVGFKKLVGNQFDTSDGFAVGTVTIMAIGRIGCILQHCCYGSYAAWGMDFGDGVPRVPVQYFEAIALFALLFFIQYIHRHQLFLGRQFFLVFALYGALRFLLEFWREQIAMQWLGIGFYQWLALAMLATGIIEIFRRGKVPPLTTKDPA